MIDNGFDLRHEDLKNVFWTNTKEIPGNGIDDDYNGYVDDVHGWNFRGMKDGTIVKNEQASSLQLYLVWKERYEHADTTALDSTEMIKYRIFRRAKEEYLQHLMRGDSSDMAFAYNINYRSWQSIEHDSAGSHNIFYGSPFFKVSPGLYHGTAVAGIIGAQRHNGIGIDGIADNVRIMPIVATTLTGDERDKDVANAIRYAVDNGARIINLSFSKRYSPEKYLVDAAVRYAESKNVLIVHAAGNDGADIDSLPNYHYPVAFYDDGTRAGNFITVGWNRPLFTERLAHPYSDYGKMNVDLFSPGSDIYTTVPLNRYDFKSATSMSTAVGSGVAALLMSYFPILSAIQVREILLQSVFKPRQDVNRPGTSIRVPFSSLSASGGIVNAYNAVKMAFDVTEKK